MDQRHRTLCAFESAINSILREFDIDTMRTKIDAYTESTIDLFKTDVLDSACSSSCNLINSAMETNSILYSNFEDVYNFYKNSEAANSLTSNVFWLNPKDVEKIRPAYFGNIIVDIRSAIDKVINGTISVEELQVKWLNHQYFDNYLLRIVKCNPSLLDEYNKNKINTDIYKKRTTTITLRRDIALNFLDAYDDEIAKLKTVASEYKNQLSNIQEEFRILVLTLNRLSNEDKIDSVKIKMLSLFMYTYLSRLVKLIKTVSFLISYKANTLGNNFSELVRVYTSNNTFRSTANTLSESAFSYIDKEESKSNVDSLLNGDNSFYTLLANKAAQSIRCLIKKNGVSPLQNVKDEKELHRSTYEYSLIPYKNASIVFKNINHSLELVRSGLLTDDPMDKIIDAARLNEPLKTYYGEYIDKVSDLTFYTSTINRTEDKLDLIDLVDTAITEVNDYNELTKMVVEEIRISYSNLTTLINDIQYRQELFNTDSITLKEVKEYLEYVENQFIKMVSQLSFKLSLRLNKLEELISKYTYLYEDKSFPNIVMLDNNDYEEMTYEFTESVNNKLDMLYMESLMYEYEYVKNLYGANVSVVFEADENNTENTSIKDRIDKLFKTIRNFFGDKIKGFIEKADNESNKNLAFINNNKEYLLNRDYTGSSVKVLPYENISISTIKSNVNGFISKLNGITPQSLASLASEGDVYKHFYDFLGTGTNKPEKQKVYDYFKTGNAKVELKEYKNGALKEHVANMIQYVEDYYKGDGKAIRESLKKIGDITEQKLSNLSNNIQSTMNESAMFIEADDNNTGNNGTNNNNTNTNEQPKEEKQSTKPEVTDVKNSKKDATVKDKTDEGIKNTGNNKFNQLKWISDCSQYFTSAVSNAIRDRVYDYLKILNGLKGGTQNTEENNNTEENKDTGNNNEGNNENQDTEGNNNTEEK